MRTVADPVVLAELTRRLEAVRIEQPRVWGSMNPHQMIVHLADVGEAALRRRPFGVPAGRPRRVTMWLALYAPVRWPRDLRTGADPASVPLAAESFEVDRRRAVDALEEIARAHAGSLADAHPIFGPLNPLQWRRWAFLHVDHHLRQFGC